MKITNAKAVDILNTCESMGDKALPLKLSYAIVKNKEHLMAEIYKPYKKSLTAVQEKYAIRDDSGKLKRTKDGNIVCQNVPEFLSEFQELREIENDFTPHTVDESILDECERERYDALTPKEVAVILEYLVNDTKRQEEHDEPV